MPHDWKAAPLDIDYLLDSGLLFKINQLFLHPFGMALTVKVDAQGNKTWDMKDSREKPEELLFDPGTYDLGERKYERFRDEFGGDQITRRQKRMGQATQYWPPGKKMLLPKKDKP